MYRGKLYFTAGATAMVPEPQHLDTGSTCFYGAEGMYTNRKTCLLTDLTWNFFRIVTCFLIKLFLLVVPLSSSFRELQRLQKDFSSWCGECSCEKREEKARTFDAIRKVNHLIDQACCCLSYRWSICSLLLLQKYVKALHAPQAWRNRQFDKIRNNLYWMTLELGINPC